MEFHSSKWKKNFAVIFRFPKERQLRSKWLNACNLSEADDVSKVYICSCHFKDEERKNKVQGKYVGNYLLAEVVPSTSRQKLLKNCAQEVVHVSNEGVQYQDTFFEDVENMSPNGKMISNDISNKPATIIDVEVNYHQPSIWLEKTAEPKDTASENILVSNVSCKENWNNNEGPDDIGGIC